MLYAGQPKHRLHHDVQEGHQLDSFLGDRSTESIESNRDGPFATDVSTFEPHSPYHGPFMDINDPATLHVGPAFLQKPESASLVNCVRDMAARIPIWRHRTGDTAHLPTT